MQVVGLPSRAKSQLPKHIFLRGGNGSRPTTKP